MKVLLVATAYPRFQGDVITPWFVKLIKRLQHKGIDVSVYTSSYRGLGNQVLDGVQIYRFRYFLKRYERLTHEETAVDRIQRGPLNILLSIFYLICGARVIIRLVKKQHFDIIHIHWPFPHILFGVLAKKYSRSRLVSTFYGVEIRLLTKKLFFLIKPFSNLINRSDIITAISTHTAKELAGIVKKRIEIIPFSTAIEERHEESTDDKKIIFVGRLVERKGIKYLVHAYNKIKDKIPHRLVIIGDGPERQQLEKLTKALRCEQNVTFTGMISDEELKRHYLGASFLVLPAVYDKKGDTEGLGVVLLESMSYSKPVIASSVGGITDIVIDQGNGLLVPPADTPALAEAIMQLATDEPLRKMLGKNAKRSVDERFNWDKITEELIALYEKSNE